jgi:sec-independent protein translocase protein TatA
MSARPPVNFDSRGRAMGEFSIYHWLIVLLVLVLLFGGRKIPELMKGMGEGIRSFKEGMAGKSSSSAPPVQGTDHGTANTERRTEKS